MDVDNIINTMIGDLQSIEDSISSLYGMVRDSSQIKYATQAYEKTLKVKEDLLQMQYAIKNVLDTNLKFKNSLKQIQDEIDDFED